jgi:5-methylcytosine-specific restriction endonuclease McrA
MPWANPRACSHQPCPAPVVNRGRCAIHQDAKKYQNLHWADLWHETLKEEPICQGCHQQASRFVDHIVPLKGRSGGKHERSNLHAYCEDCFWRRIGAVWGYH